ncbi:MAG: hypothetical protein B1H08_06195 [Candidatus Omnitrophica bacterium 4484_171]|nr:MAG: hypothetical protein B1H08_06195 [Candidatus Omnitrophica bacterium 4484_171]
MNTKPYIKKLLLLCVFALFLMPRNTFSEDLKEELEAKLNTLEENIAEEKSKIASLKEEII